MTARSTIAVIRPSLDRADFAEVLAGWLDEGIAAARGPVTARVAAIVIVPEYLHAAPRSQLAEMAELDWTGVVVAVAAYGGRTRGRHAIEDARAVLAAHGALLTGPSLGVDAARVRAHGFDAADVLLRDLLLDALADRPVVSGTGRRPAPPTPRG
ncbi:hypothetical protein [Actinomycetospora termitidis]|uniref:Uncharacterized protein n=1 Tax=Actinomycetospora termitidis TaxID=3053470 RepID=A0ABT7M372_9PSEU|nr:hypothetical protein [Actinomycetospora sp. Odt1-22]MDL5154649.1 hypothetical protein [Actinomycetospora sp. Odt1-22]